MDGCILKFIGFKEKFYKNQNSDTKKSSVLFKIYVAVLLNVQRLCVQKTAIHISVCVA